MDEIIREKLDSLGQDQYLLPVGIRDKDGVLHNVVTLTPMTGETEEAMANPKIADNPAKMITEMFISVIEEVQGIPKVTRELVRSLTTQDRDFLTVMNYITSFKDTTTFESQCKHCGELNEIEQDLTSLPVNYMDDNEPREFVIELPRGYRDREGKIYKKLTVTFPNGMAQERMAKLAKANISSATTLYLQLITTKIEGMNSINPEIFKKMTKKDRDFIVKAIDEKKVGINLKFTTICSSCGGEYEGIIPLTALLGEH